jgi:Recombinase.
VQRLVIEPAEAEIVEKIFNMRAGGRSLVMISNFLFENNIPSPTGKRRWSRETINKILHNEKYTGRVMLQKTYVDDLFVGKQKKNDGSKERYLVRYHHEAIISDDLFKKCFV